MKIKTTELTGPALDWAVAKCEGLHLVLDPMGFRRDSPDSPLAGWWVQNGDLNLDMIVGRKRMHRNQHDGYSPSTDWAQGGPIIEREGIWVQKYNENLFDARKQSEEYYDQGIDGETYLQAAMSCYVAFKLGDEIDIPDELI